MSRRLLLVGASVVAGFFVTVLALRPTMPIARATVTPLPEQPSSVVVMSTPDPEPSPPDFATAAAPYLARLDNQIAYDQLTDLADTWSRTDPAAVARCLGTSSDERLAPLLTAALERWGATDPVAALTWAEIPASPADSAPQLSALLAGLAQRDSDLTFLALNELPAAHRTALIDRHPEWLEALVLAYPATLPDFVPTLTPGQQTVLAQRFARRVREFDPVTVAPLLAGLPRDFSDTLLDTALTEHSYTELAHWLGASASSAP